MSIMINKPKPLLMLRISFAHGVLSSLSGFGLINEPIKINNKKIRIAHARNSIFFHILLVGFRFSHHLAKAMNSTRRILPSNHPCFIDQIQKKQSLTFGLSPIFCLDSKTHPKYAKTLYFFFILLG